MDRQAVRRLSYLANRISHNAEIIRNSRKPHQLTRPRQRLLRHLMELNRVRDSWADTYEPSRRIKFPRPPCPCDSVSFWQTKNRFKR